MGTVKHVISLSDSDRARLAKTAKSSKVGSTIRKRCQILLALDESQGKHITRQQCIEVLGVSPTGINNTVKKYLTEGIDAVLSFRRNEKSNTGSLKLDGRAEAQIIALACSEAPEGHTRWTLRLLAERSRMILEQPVGKDAIARALKKTNLNRTSMTTGASPKRKTRNS